MKKVVLTVAQLLFLHEVSSDQGFNSQKMGEVLDENQNPEEDVEVEFTEGDVEDVAESVQWQIDQTELSEEDLATANSILEVLGVSPPAETEEIAEVAEAPAETEEIAEVAEAPAETEEAPAPEEETAPEKPE